MVFGFFLVELEKFRVKVLFLGGLEIILGEEGVMGSRKNWVIRVGVRKI